jgi:hypothetical protein
MQASFQKIIRDQKLVINAFEKKYNYLIVSRVEKIERFIDDIVLEQAKLHAQNQKNAVLTKYEGLFSSSELFPKDHDKISAKECEIAGLLLAQEVSSQKKMLHDIKAEHKSMSEMLKKLAENHENRFSQMNIETLQINTNHGSRSPLTGHTEVINIPNEGPYKNSGLSASLQITKSPHALSIHQK